ncbi:hypothetical protein GE061_011326 [Apolygus lucorum]|uniref:HTH CENPB-type domain-containing protein n=1 Tax=Apolygus lucorum TaxID=248454 RepID=A0A8S9Y148_APOLU|nr:hypothetical protein GE061_011326 [Apolygus lucorum]
MAGTKRKTERKKVVIKRRRYSEESLQKATEAVKQGLMSQKHAEKTFGVPRSTIQFRLSDKFSRSALGRPTILTKEEEEEIQEWIMICASKGFPRRKLDIASSVAGFLQLDGRANPFSGGIPGKSWFKGFFKRHPQLSLRTSESVTQASACVTQEDLFKWFDQIEAYLKNNDYFKILEDPRRVFNSDESFFALNPENSKVVAKKGVRNVYEVDSGQAKVGLTVLFTFNAAGEQVPPMLVFPYQRIPKDIAKSVPSHWGIGRSDTGWMRSEVFFEFVGNIFLRFLEDNDIPRPVILFIDGHKSHLSLHLSKLCTEVGIVLIALYPNSTRIIQPADVAAFRPIKEGWRQGVLQWRRDNPNEEIKKTHVGSTLERVFKEYAKPQTLIHGFKACGICPWDKTAIDSTKCLGKKPSTPVQKAPIHMISKDLEKIVGEDFFHMMNTVEELEIQPVQILAKKLYDIHAFFKDSMSSPTAILHHPQNNHPALENTFQHVALSHASLSPDQPLLCTVEVTPLSDTLPPANENPIAQTEPIEPTILDKAIPHVEVTPKQDAPPRTGPSDKPTLRKMFVYPETPKRKGKKVVKRLPFALTSDEWVSQKEEEEEKKKKMISDKEERKQHRETRKQEKATTAKYKQKKKTSKKEKGKPKTVRKKIEATSSPKPCSSTSLETPTWSPDRGGPLPSPTPPSSPMLEAAGSPEHEEDIPDIVSSPLATPIPSPLVVINGMRILSGLCYKCAKNLKEINPGYTCFLCGYAFCKTCLALTEDPDNSDSLVCCRECDQIGEDLDNM